eukprot:1050537-Prymnesium_polylepis.1
MHSSRQHRATWLSILARTLAGFCAVSNTLPVPQNAENAALVKPVLSGNGLAATFGETIQVVCGEPHATFLRVGVIDNGNEIAYEAAVLGRLRCGYRVFPLRGSHGTRIELAYLFVRISFWNEQNRSATARQVRMQSWRVEAQSAQLQEAITEQSNMAQKMIDLNNEKIHLNQELAKLRGTVTRLQQGRGSATQLWQGPGDSELELTT